MTDRDQRLQAKRFRARRRKFGPCSVCTFREAAANHYHCRKWPERQGGQCESDGKLPVFQFDADVMLELRGNR